MAKKLFVGGLSWDTTEAGLRQAFGRFGTVTEAKVITDRATGRSRGFGFVTFDEPDAAQSAKATLHNTELEGRTISVDEANERRPHSADARNAGRRRPPASRGSAGHHGRH